jgi:hypothetical protein
MTPWATFMLVLKNWKYVVQFVEILEKAIINGYNAYDLNKSLHRLNEGFKHAKSVEDSANAARSINDAFRK